MNEENKVFKEALKLLKDKKIWKINGINFYDQPFISFNLGEPYLEFRELDKNNEFDKYSFKRFEKIIKSDQKYYDAVIKSDYCIALHGDWEIKYKDGILLQSILKQKIKDNKYYKARFNFLFLGHKITDIKLKNDYISIDFSNNLSINVYRYLIDNKGGYILLGYRNQNNYNIGLSIEKGVVNFDEIEI